MSKPAAARQTTPPALTAIRDEHELAKRCVRLLHRFKMLRFMDCSPSFAMQRLHELQEAVAATPEVPREFDPFHAGKLAAFGGTIATSVHSAVFDLAQRLWGTCHLRVTRPSVLTAQAHVPGEGHVVRYTTEFARVAPTEADWSAETWERVRSQLADMDRMTLPDEYELETYLCAEFQQAAERCGQGEPAEDAPDTDDQPSERPSKCWLRYMPGRFYYKGRPFDLKGKPLDVLKALDSAPGKTLTLIQLQDKLWEGSQSGEEAVRTAVAYARTALREAIRTVSKRYKGDPIQAVARGSGRTAWRLDLPQ